MLKGSVISKLGSTIPRGVYKSCSSLVALVKPPVHRGHRVHDMGRAYTM